MSDNQYMDIMVQEGTGLTDIKNRIAIDNPTSNFINISIQKLWFPSITLYLGNCNGVKFGKSVG